MRVFPPRRLVAISKDEAKAVREGVGLIDATAFTKHLLKGRGATQFLDWFTCNKLPKVGRINLTYALTGAGTTRTEYTIVRIAEDEYYLVSAGAGKPMTAIICKKLLKIKSLSLDICPCRMSHHSGAYSPSQVQSRVMC